MNSYPCCNQRASKDRFSVTVKVLTISFNFHRKTSRGSPNSIKTRACPSWCLRPTIAHSGVRDLQPLGAGFIGTKNCFDATRFHQPDKSLHVRCLCVRLAYPAGHLVTGLATSSSCVTKQTQINHNLIASSSDGRPHQTTSFSFSFTLLPHHGCAFFAANHCYTNTGIGRPTYSISWTLHTLIAKSTTAHRSFIQIPAADAHFEQSHTAASFLHCACAIPRDLKRMCLNLLDTPSLQTPSFAAPVGRDEDRPLLLMAPLQLSTGIRH